MSKLADEEDNKYTDAISTNTAPSSTSKNSYALTQYWNDRYTKTCGLFDWYIEYDCLIPLFTHYQIQHTEHILNLGCGNNQLSEDLYKAGYHHITNIDISDVVIQSMINRYPASKYPLMSWQVMDASDMSTFPADTFDLIIEKGTIDALTCSSEHDTTISSLIRESYRVLRPSGHFMLITHGAPDQRYNILINKTHTENSDSDSDSGSQPDPGISSSPSPSSSSSPSFVNWSIHCHRVAFSSSALMIRALRSRLHGRPLSSVTPDIFKEAATYVQQLLLTLKTDVEGETITKLSGSYEHVSPDQANYCWVYVCTKPPLNSTTTSTATTTTPTTTGATTTNNETNPVT